MLIKLKYGYQPGEYSETTLTDRQFKLAPTITPTAVPTKTQAEKDYPLIDLLPYKGAGFVIDRYVLPKVIAIKAKGMDQELVKEEVAKWFRDNNSDPRDIQIKWE